jgi:hypothetical protein
MRRSDPTIPVREALALLCPGALVPVLVRRKRDALRRALYDATRPAKWEWSHINGLLDTWADLAVAERVAEGRMDADTAALVHDCQRALYLQKTLERLGEGRDREWVNDNPTFDADVKDALVAALLRYIAHRAPTWKRELAERVEADAAKNLGDG